MDITKIFNANVYINDVDHIGQAKEVTLPELSIKTSEHMGLGMVATVELPSGIEAMTMAFKWDTFDAEMFKVKANPFRTVPVKVKASAETYDSDGRSAEIPIVWTARVRFKKVPLGGLKSQEAAEFDDECAVDYVKVEHDGQELLELDAINNIFRVNGEDLLEQFRANTVG